MNASRGKSRRFVSVIGFACALLLALAACRGGDDDDGGTTTEGVQLINDGELTVCTHLPYEPFQYRNKDGDIVGFDVDLIDLLAKELGVKQTIVDIDWNQVTSGAAYKAKTCELGMGGMTITPEREEAIAFSEPYFEATQALLVKKDSGYTGLADLDGKRVGVQTDTTGEIYGNEHSDEFGYTPVTFDDYSLEVNAVKSGTIDAAINDDTVLYKFEKTNPDTEVVEEFDTGEEYGFGALKDDKNATKLLDMLNAAIEKARDDGTYDEIYKRWFGVAPGGGQG